MIKDKKINQKKIKTYNDAKKILYSIGGINEKEANIIIKNMYKNGK